MIIEQNGLEDLPHVSFEVVCEHAQQHVSPNALSEAMMDRSHFEIDGLETSESALHRCEIFGIPIVFVASDPVASGPTQVRKRLRERREATLRLGIVVGRVGSRRGPGFEDADVSSIPPIIPEEVDLLKSQNNFR
jgi:hypothetical protein